MGREAEPAQVARVRFVIMGEPASKANSRKLVTIGGRPAFIKSQKARDYERDALLQIPAAAKVMFPGLLRATIRIWYASERPDLDESVILDVLQAKTEGTGKDRKILRRGVYLNDRQVREKHVFHAIDRVMPRAEIEIEQIIEQASLL
jgi:Holliday junction resolvase RusA-like endonuclease